MKAIICLDENKGMMFNKRRQSRDKFLVDKILELTENSRLFLSPYTAGMVGEGGNIAVCEALAEKQEKGFYFLEEKVADLTKFSEIYLFLWNRSYPADLYFDFDLEQEGFFLAESEDFRGSSHEKITLRIYRRA